MRSPIHYSKQINNTMINSRAIYLQTILLILLLPSVASFIVNPTTRTALLSIRTTPIPLNLHVDPIHIHRDSLLRLDDPILLGTEEHHNRRWANTNAAHKVTLALAPLALAFYLVGIYLGQYHHGETMSVLHDITVDPMFGGGILIGAGLFMIKWSASNAILSPP